MRGIVPDAILDRKDKLAYAPPQKQWNRGVLRPWLEQMLCSAERRTEVFNPRAVAKTRERLSRGGSDRLLWRVASTEAWFQTMVDRPKSAAASSGPALAEISRASW
jgi:asparagine synthase (glutamine-hydrolysing)